MIGYDDIGGFKLSSDLVVEAVAEVGALSGAAVSVFAFDGVPEAVFWNEGYIAERAIVCLTGPVFYECKFGIGFVEQFSLSAEVEFKTAFTEVISPALCEDGVEGEGQAIGEEGDVFIDQLFLECNSKSADQYFGGGAGELQYGGYEVGEAFTDAGASLCDEASVAF